MAYPYLTDIFRDIFGIDVAIPIPTFGTMVVVSYYVFLTFFKREIARYEQTGRINPEQKFSASISDFGYVSFMSGLVGARLFHVLEYPAQYMASPLDIIFSRGGFSALGGLAGGAVACTLFLRRKKVPMLPVLDATAPALMLGYAVGRLGCQIAGDGDWGIPADLTLKPSWFPTWLWAQTYDNNVLGTVIPAPGVYPTPIYESLASLALFAVLWAVRTRGFAAGWLFSLYLFLSGLERFLIEKIRVNATYEFFGIESTQAELISVVLIILGVAGLWKFSTLDRKNSEKVILPLDKSKRHSKG